MSEQAMAIFDLDGTLTTRDSFVSYLLTYGRRRRKVGALSMFPLRISAYLLKRVKDFQLKQQLLRSFLGGVPREKIQEHTEWFCQNWLPKNFHPVGQRFLREHLDQGHRVVLLSASPDLYVPEVAKCFGIHETVCTQVEFQGELCTGNLIGDNCKGIHKLEAIKKHLGCEHPQSESYAYGDSEHDLPILRWVAHGIMVQRNSSIDLGIKA